MNLDYIFKISIIFLIILFNGYYVFYDISSILVNVFILITSLLGVLYLIKNEIINKYKKYIISSFAILLYILYTFIFPQEGILVDTLLITVIKITAIIMALIEIFKIKETKYIYGILLGLIYLDGGLWKANSIFWWNGLIFEFEYYSNNLITNQWMFELLKPLFTPIGWFITIYQLTFLIGIIFIKNKKLKILFLGLGILQHIAIIFMYNLTIFGLFMIALYIPLFKEDNLKKIYFIYFAPVIFCIFLAHLSFYSLNHNRVMLSNEHALIEDLNREIKMKPIYILNNYINTYIYKTVNVFTPLKQFSKNQIKSLLTSDKKIFSKKYLRVKKENKIIYSNVPGDMITTFSFNPYENRWLSLLYINHSNFQNIEKYIKTNEFDIEEVVVFIRIKNDKLKIEKYTFNKEINLKFKNYIETSVYNPKLLYSLPLGN